MPATKTDLEIALAPIKVELTIIKWMMVVALALNATILVKAFAP